MILLWVHALAAAALALFTAAAQPNDTPAPSTAARPEPPAETLAYSIEWRLIHAGNARLTWAPDAGGYQSKLFLESAGLVSRLYKVNNEYSSISNRQLCIESSLLRANEGGRRRETTVTFDAQQRKARYLERDLVKNTSVSDEIEIGACEHDVIGALYRLRTMNLEPGSAAQIPISDGKKAVMARIEAQERETIKTDFGTYKTIRYEAFLFNNVLYRRRGRLFVWLTDDDRKVPVQVRVRLPFYVGTVTLQLLKQGKS
jgi:hypothetical protein